MKLAKDMTISQTISAISESLNNAYRLFSNWRKSTVIDNDKYLFALTDIPFPFFNCVLNAKFTELNAASEIKQLIKQADEKNVPLLWYTSPSSTPANLSQYLTHNGFVQVDKAIGMATNLLTMNTKPIPENITIEMVNDEATLRVWCDTLVIGYEMPSTVADELFSFYKQLGFANAQSINYLAKLNGKAVGTSSLILKEGIASIFSVSTIKEARRKGVGRAITQAPLQLAKSLGYEIGVLQSSEMGLPVYESLGFVELCQFTQYYRACADAAIDNAA
jgi:GNAT superfamily N-acetyltransferase